MIQCMTNVSLFGIQGSSHGSALAKSTRFNTKAKVKDNLIVPNNKLQCGKVGYLTFE